MDLAALDDVFEAVDSEALPSAAGAVASAASVEGSEVVPVVIVKDNIQGLRVRSEFVSKTDHCLATKQAIRSRHP